MKTATALASIIAFGVAAAQPHLPPPTQSGPFALKVESSNKTIDGRSLSACHSGAGFESLCLSTKPSEFYFNTTSYDADQVDGYSKTGLVVYNMIAHRMYFGTRKSLIILTALLTLLIHSAHSVGAPRVLLQPGLQLGPSSLHPWP